MSDQLPAISVRPGDMGSVQVAELQRARRAAVDAMADAEQKEQAASSARRTATRLRRTYERLLMEYNGQERLPGT